MERFVGYNIARHRVVPVETGFKIMVERADPKTGEVRDIEIKHYKNRKHAQKMCAYFNNSQNHYGKNNQN